MLSPAGKLEVTHPIEYLDFLHLGFGPNKATRKTETSQIDTPAIEQFEASRRHLHLSAHVSLHTCQLWLIVWHGLGYRGGGGMSHYWCSGRGCVGGCYLNSFSNCRGVG